MSRKSFLCLLLALCLAVSGFCGLMQTDAYAAVSFSDDPASIQDASNSVIMVYCYDKDGNHYATGSAFAAFAEGIFVTNYHVIAGDVYSITGHTESGDEFEFQNVIAYSEQYDLAILETRFRIDVQPLEIGSTENMLKGEKVVAIGSPLGLLNSVSMGVYSGLVKENGMNYLQFTASISHGSSGGALFNDQGQVIGVTSASYTAGQNINLAVPIEKVQELWDYAGKKISIEDFYNLFEHIQTFDVAYIFAHPEDFDDKEVIVQGYISYVQYFKDSGARIILVNDASEVLGLEAFEEYGKMYSANGSARDATGGELVLGNLHEIGDAKDLEKLDVEIADASILNSFYPRNYVVVRCKLFFDETKLYVTPKGWALWGQLESIHN